MLRYALQKPTTACVYTFSGEGKKIILVQTVGSLTPKHRRDQDHATVYSSPLSLMSKSSSSSPLIPAEVLLLLVPPPLDPLGELACVHSNKCHIKVRLVMFRMMLLPASRVASMLEFVLRLFLCRCVLIPSYPCDLRHQEADNQQRVPDDEKQN